MEQRIAILSMACLFPGAKSPEEFWENLKAAKDLTRDATAQDMGLDPKALLADQKGVPDRFYNLRGGFIEDFHFDSQGYKVHPKRLEGLDEVCLWPLSVARQALERAGVWGEAKALERCGLVLGNLSFPTRSSNRLCIPLVHQAQERALKTLLENPAVRFEPVAPTALENRRISGRPALVAAEALGLGGVCFSLDAACASSLYALALAAQYLAVGKVDLMLAGAVSAADPLFVNLGFSTFGAYPLGRDSRPLDQSSKGLVSGEGAGMFLLKRYEDAVRDKDEILATLVGYGLSNDGTGKSVLSPNPKGQQLCFERAYPKGGQDPKDVEYVECHATGTPLGDVTELGSMEAFFGAKGAQFPIGSVKSNFGHLLTAAGMAAMMKVVLGMQKGEIPATLHLQDPLSSPSGWIGPDKIVARHQPWPGKNPQLRLAGVNAFGFGGTNAHVVLEYQKTPKKHPQPKTPSLLPLSILGLEAWFGPAQGLLEFQDLVYQGKSAARPLGENRWSGLERNRAVPGPQAAYLEPFEFDYLGNKIPPNPLDPLIAQQLLMLKVAGQAIEDAGLKKGGKVAVLIAMETDLGIHRFRARVELDLKLPQALERAGLKLSEREISGLKELAKEGLHNKVGVNQFTSFIGNIMASRVSSLYDFSGPALTVSAEEGSAYKALELAQVLLSLGEADAVVLGGVDLLGSAEEGLLGLKEDPHLVKGGPGFSWDQSVEGSHLGEGAGALVLVTKERALKERLGTYGHIERVERFGPKTGAGALKALYKPFGMPGYLEVSGRTQDKLAQIEAKGLSRELGGTPVALGSISSVLGRLESAQGIAALVKVALALSLKTLPGTAGWSGPKKALGLKSPFYVPPESRPWLEFGDRPRVAGINHLERSGEDYHLILTEDTRPQPVRPLERHRLGPWPVLLASDSLPELIGQLESLDLEPGPRALSRKSLAPRASKGQHRLVLLGRDKTELEAEKKVALAALRLGPTQEWLSVVGSCYSPSGLAPTGKVAFVYPGGFNSYVGMGRGLLRAYPELLELPAGYAKDPQTLFRSEQIFPQSLLPLGDGKKEQAQLVGDAIGMFETGINHSMLLTQTVKNLFGVNPDMAFGYSMGEVSLAFSLGLWAKTDSLSEYLHKNPVFQTRLAGPMETLRKAWGLKKNQPVDWVVYSVGASQDRVEKAIKGKKRLYLMIVNSPSEVVLGGQAKAVEELLLAQGWQARPLPVSDAIHGDFVELDRPALEALHRCPIGRVPETVIYTALTYGPTEVTEAQLAKNIAGSYCKTVDFPQLVERTYRDGARIFVEIGPRQSCSPWIKETLGDRPHLAVGLDQKGTSGEVALVRALARLCAAGVLVDWSALFGPQKAQPVGMIKPVELGGPPLDLNLVADGRKLLGKKASPVLTIFPEIPEGSPEPLPLAKPALAPTPAPPEEPAPLLWGEESSDQRQVPLFPPGALLAQSSAHHRLYQTQHRLTENHQAFLEARKQSLRQFSGTLGLGQTLLGSAPEPGVAAAPESSYQARLLLGAPTLEELLAQHQTAFVDSRRTKASDPSILWDERDLMEFASGKVAPVFGPEFGPIDGYGPRVRLPLPPYLLVNRVVELQATPGEFKPSKIVTEYDVPKGAWYAVDGQIPWAVAVEAGQCDLVLISYLGIDFEAKGQYLYRLLDCTLTFMGEMPQEGQTMRYEIYIDSFARHGHNLLFFFHYDCFVEGRLVHTMTGGCAGFFSQADLDKGRGVIQTEKEKAERAKVQKSSFTPLLGCNKTRFDRSELVRLCRGEIAACMGQGFDQQGQNPGLRFSTEEFLMLDQITQVNPQGGIWGLGEIWAQKEFKPDHWYFTCHFQDDPCLAGSLMAEGCVQLLEFYLLYLGMQTQTQNARFVPIKNLANKVRCRGQVLPGDGLLEYKMEVKEVGLSPRPYAKANVEILLEGKVIVDFLDVGIELVEKTGGDARTLKPQRELAFDDQAVEEFALGSLARCFGPAYLPFEGRPSQRNPNGDLQLISRVPKFEGTPGNLKVPAYLESEYDVPKDAWFLRENQGGVVPYAVIMEIALQPCGFLGAAVQSPLAFVDQQLCFRNLDAQAELLQDPPLAGERITAKIWLDSTSATGGTIIQQYRFELWVLGEKFYQGKTTFGYFTPKALANQLGLDSGKKRPLWHETARPLPLVLPLSEHPELFAGELRLGGNRLNFLDQIALDPIGGRMGKGYVYGKKAIDPLDWFYSCHFFEDPVMPGSLGVEAILQSLKAFAWTQGLAQGFKQPRFTHQLGTTSWKYRGQIIPENQWMETEVHLKQIQTEPNGAVTLVADADLYKDGLRIYEVKDVSIVIEEV
ncbi:MAG: hypothetical protein A2600_11940 [Candidatus Lambdaproteobacteria bacterium RIFOXYD1_FULL_56_27]|nr:MAG: hypothetical protein A2600_11940 [Candidatus Lambdaproteobacteria bacterium RIFOXYD1_FULL_56_27]